MYVCMHACMYACIVCMYVCMHVCMLYVRMNAHSCRAPESSAPSHTLRGCRERENNVNNKNSQDICSSECQQKEQQNLKKKINKKNSE